MYPSKAKKIFLALSIIVPFFFYCLYYYTMVFKNAPYKFTEFKSVVFQYGTADSMLNKYNSATGEYQYLDKHNLLVKKHMNVKTSELLYLHRKASDLGFWNFPADERTDSAKNKGQKPVRYIMEFNYIRKSKRVVFDSNYDGPEKLTDANERMIGEIQKVLNEAEARLKN